MGSYYEIQIDAPESVLNKIKKKFGKSNRDFDDSWSYIIDESDLRFIKGTDFLLEILHELKTSEILSEVKRVLVWYMYEYENQCNIEFSPYFLKVLGELNVVLCISCWEK